MRLLYSLAVESGYLADEITLATEDFEYNGPVHFDRVLAISRHAA